MEASSWLSVLGAFGGLIGAVTGVAGAVLGYVSYHELRRLKALDLRLELRRLEVDAGEALRELPGRAEYAKQSRVAVAAALGTLGSGGTEVFKDQVAKDLPAIRALEVGFKPSPDHYATLTDTELEARLVEVHRLNKTVARYERTYEAAIAKDDKDREYIRSQHQTTVRRCTRQGQVRASATAFRRLTQP